MQLSHNSRGHRLSQLHDPPPTYTQPLLAQPFSTPPGADVVLLLLLLLLALVVVVLVVTTLGVVVEVVIGRALLQTACA